MAINNVEMLASRVVGSHFDILCRSINARGRSAKSGQWLSQKTRTTTDIQCPLSNERPQGGVGRRPVPINCGTNITQTRRIEAVQHG